MNQQEFADIVRKAGKIEVKDKLLALKGQLKIWVEQQFETLQLQFEESLKEMSQKMISLNQECVSYKLNVQNLQQTLCEQQAQISQFLTQSNHTQHFKLVQKKFRKVLDLLREQSMITDEQQVLYAQNNFNIDQTPIVIQYHQMKKEGTSSTILNERIKNQKQETQKKITELEERVQSQNEIYTQQIQELQNQLKLLKQKLSQRDKDIKRLQATSKFSIRHQNQNVQCDDPGAKILYRFINFQDMVYKKVDSFNKVQNFDLRSSSQTMGKTRTSQSNSRYKTLSVSCRQPTNATTFL